MFSNQKRIHRHQKQQASPQTKPNHSHSWWSCSYLQERIASVPTSGTWRATTHCPSSSCAGNTWPQLCARWVSSPCWPCFFTLFSDRSLWNIIRINALLGISCKFLLVSDRQSASGNVCGLTKQKLYPQPRNFHLNILLFICRHLYNASGPSRLCYVWKVILLDCCVSCQPDS